MYSRPRCREWEPLLTQQLRLRDLIKISGVNIKIQSDNNTKSKIYYTLHFKPFSKPFYTSEKLEEYIAIDWSEINCQDIHKSARRNVCIRVWENQNNNIQERNNKTSSTFNVNETVLSSDKLLFLWGVHFSGLVLISNRKDIKLKENSLIFHLNGGTFASADTIQDDNEETISLINDAIPNDSQTNCDYNSDRYSKSNFSQINSNKPNPDYLTQFNNFQYSSPKSFDGFLSSSLAHENNYPNSLSTVAKIIHESRYLKVRYVKLEFAKSEIRPSYTLQKLLLLQDFQRRIKNRNDSAKTLADRICMKSAHCLNLELIRNKPLYYETQKQPGMGKALSKLLSQQQAPPKPEILLKAQELRRNIECVKFRCRMLAKEREKNRQTNKSLQFKLGKIIDENIEMESFVLNSYHTLCREKEKINEEKQNLDREQEVFHNVRLALLETRQELLRELNDIYSVKKNTHGLYAINEIHLPDAESYMDTTSTPTELSIALGYVAHTVFICSRIINIPLRNPIKLDGSRSKILDNIKLLPPTDRIFPLFCRGTPPPNVLLYGVFLLNQNISQLKFLLGMSKGDLRSTLSNLWDVMNGISSEMTNKKLIEDIRQLDLNSLGSNSLDTNSIDTTTVIVPQLVSPTSFKIPRISRSDAGSYEDDPLIIDNLKKFGSEPIITITEFE
ncbi:unnamed protein product [Diamesa tonsa]